MSKFLKAIVNIFLIAAILTAVAILVPPVLGITTTIIDSREMETNLPLGSITYSEDVEVKSIKAGDEVLKEDANSTFAYVVVEGNAETGKFTVLDASDKEGPTTEVTIRNYVSRVFITVPFIGYIIVAMQSTEGMIIVGLIVLFVIILFILSELWKKHDSEEDEDEDGDDENDFVYEDTAEKVKKALDSTAEDVALYGHLDDEETRRDIERLAEEPTKRFEEPAEELPVPGGKTAEFEGRTHTQDAAAPEEAVQDVPEEEPEELPADGDRIMPVERLTLEEIVEQVKRSGAEPTVRRDPVTGIDVVDLSEVL